jgi:dihydroflavonol-4-reductase
MNDDDNGKTVLVTGGSGFVGGWIIVALFRAGYRVRTTIRRLAREAEVRSAVGRQVEVGDRLSFHAADLLADDGWDQAAEGADYVVHVASPLPVGEFLRQDLIRPAREGTLRVLRAAERAGARRVVLTGSGLAAMPPAGWTGGPTDETVWTDPMAEETGHYGRSKTLAEQDAWRFVREHRGEATLVTILPGCILGPVMGPDSGGSAGVIERMLKGRMPGIPNIGFGIVDVRDLADLHVRAMTHPAAAGERLIADGEFIWLADFPRILRERFGARAAKVTTRRVPDFVIRLSSLFSAEARLLVPLLGKRSEFAAAKADRLLHWRTRPAVESIIDCAQSLIARHGSNGDSVTAERG